MSLRSLRSLSVLGLMTVSAFASAQTTYTTQSTFLANVQPGFYLETFDSLAQFTEVPSPLSFSSGGFAYTAGAVGAVFFNVGPTGDTWLSTDIPNRSIVFTFASSNVTAVGGEFFTTNFDGDENFGSITATLNDGSTLVIDPSDATTFGGFTTSVPLTSLTIRLTNISNNNYSTVNNLIVGSRTAVPEPGTAALLLGSALSGAGVLLRRRR